MKGSGCGLTGICVEGLTETTNNLIRDSPSLDRDLNLGPSKCRAGDIPVVNFSCLKPIHRFIVYRYIFCSRNMVL